MLSFLNKYAAIDYRGMHRDLCDMRNRAAGNLADKLYGLRPREEQVRATTEQLRAFERECREFLEEVYSSLTA